MTRTPRGRRLAVLGLVAATLIVAAQVRGFWRSDTLAAVSPAGSLYAVGHHRGRMLLLWSDGPVEEPGGARLHLQASPPKSIDLTLPRRLQPRFTRPLSFVIEDVDLFVPTGPASSLVAVAVPAWALLLVALLGPARRVAIVLRERRRFMRGRCVACGYDLRGADGQCAECGTHNTFGQPVTCPSVRS